MGDRQLLCEYTSFANVPPFIGEIEYIKKGNQPVSVGILQGFIPNQGDAWSYTLDSLMTYFDRVFGKKNEIQEMPPTPVSLLELASHEVPSLFQELIGGIYLEAATLLGRRTAELHIALSKETDNKDFARNRFPCCIKGLCINPCSLI